MKPIDPSQVLLDDQAIWYRGQKYIKEKPQEPKSLYETLVDEGWCSPALAEEICRVTNKWLSSQSWESNKWDKDYEYGWMDCREILMRNVK